MGKRITLYATKSNDYILRRSFYSARADLNIYIYRLR